MASGPREKQALVNKFTEPYDHIKDRKYLLQTWLQIFIIICQEKEAPSNTHK